MYQKWIICLLIILAAFFSTANAEEHDNTARILENAWREYRLRNLKQAGDLFSKIRRTAQTREDYCQASIGLAFCLQFSHQPAKAEKIKAFEQAIVLYNECEKKIGENSRIIPFLMSMRAECHFMLYQLTGNQMEFKKAEQLWSRLQRNRYGSLAAQDALLFQASFQTDKLADKTARENIDNMKEYVRPIYRSVVKRETDWLNDMDRKIVLAPAMAKFIGFYYLWAGDYELCLEWLEIYSKLGIAEQKAASDIRFRIARIADTKLKDVKTAVNYYVKLYKNSSNDPRADFAREREKQLMNKNSGQDIDKSKKSGEKQ